jgi:beta-galactosidase/beta-glucuronidase
MFMLIGQVSAGEFRQTLDGAWQFTTNPALEAEATGATSATAAIRAAGTPVSTEWDSITVPGNWDALPAYAKHKGTGWYRRTFIPAKECAGKVVRLRCEAVYHDAEVTLNGTVLGTHRGGYTPFEFEVSKYLRIGQENTVLIRADNTYQRGAWWHWGGISRHVTLIANEPVRFSWQHIRSEPDLTNGTAKIFVRYKITNADATAHTIQVSSCLDRDSKPLITCTANVPAGGSVLVDGNASLTKAQVRLWDFDHPNLYRLTTQATIAGVVQHEVSDRFGIRSIVMRPDALVLNGEPVCLVGFNRVSDHPQFGNTEPDQVVIQDVALMKRAGATMSRIMHYAQAPNFLDQLDEKGLLIVCEGISAQRSCICCGSRAGAITSHVHSVHLVAITQLKPWEILFSRLFLLR